MMKAQGHVTFGQFTRFTYDQSPRERRSGDPPPQKAENSEKTTTPPNAAGTVERIVLTRAVVISNPADALHAKIRAFEAQMAHIQRRNLPENPMQSFGGAAWIILDSLLALGLIAYGITYGISGGHDESSRYDWAYWGDWPDRIQPIIMAVWVLSILPPLLVLRRHLFYWLIHSAAKFAVAIPFLIVSMIAGYLISQLTQNLVTDLLWIVSVGCIELVAISSIVGGYTACRGAIHDELNSEEGEISRRIRELMPEPPAPELEPMPERVIYDNIID